MCVRFSEALPRHFRGKLLERRIQSTGTAGVDRETSLNDPKRKRGRARALCRTVLSTGVGGRTAFYRGSSTRARRGRAGRRGPGRDGATWWTCAADRPRRDLRATGVDPPPSPASEVWSPAPLGLDPWLPVERRWDLRAVAVTKGAEEDRCRTGSGDWGFRNSRCRRVNVLR